MSAYRATLSSPKEMAFADPDNFQNTVKISHTVQPKRAGVLNVYNAQNQINMQRLAHVVNPSCPEDACSPNTEKLALRFQISGSTASQADVIKLWEDFKVVGDAAMPDLSKGFLPDGIVLTFV